MNHADKTVFGPGLEEKPSQRVEKCPSWFDFYWTGNEF
jgi:hypothetical protein